MRMGVGFVLVVVDGKVKLLLLASHMHGGHPALVTSHVELKLAA